MHKRRQRILALSVGILVALGGVGTGLFLLAKGNKAKPSASPSASPSVGGVACGGTVPEAASQEKKTYKKAPAIGISRNKTYTATMETSCGTIVMKLDPKLGLQTVNSFVFLARKLFFDGLIFHRIARDFVIQGGDPTGTGSGGPGYKTVNAPPKDAKYPEGTVAMAKAGTDPPGASSSQFFVVASDHGQQVLTPDYAVVGLVSKGMDVVAKIMQLATGDTTPPKAYAYIESAELIIKLS